MDTINTLSVCMQGIPYRFAWQELPPIEMSLDVRSQWQAKF